ALGPRHPPGPAPVGRRRRADQALGAAHGRGDARPLPRSRGRGALWRSSGEAPQGARRRIRQGAGAGGLIGAGPPSGEGS
ncbi:hypothetical protein QU38_01590, partial [Staphylococcus aureus]